MRCLAESLINNGRTCRCTAEAGETGLCYYHAKMRERLITPNRVLRPHTIQVTRSDDGSVLYGVKP
jgi:hypothetical protein